LQNFEAVVLFESVLKKRKAIFIRISLEVYKEVFGDVTPDRTRDQSFKRQTLRPIHVLQARPYKQCQARVNVQHICSTFD